MRHDARRRPARAHQRRRARPRPRAPEGSPRHGASTPTWSWSPAIRSPIRPRWCRRSPSGAPVGASSDRQQTTREQALFGAVTSSIARVAGQRSPQSRHTISRPSCPVHALIDPRPDRPDQLHHSSSRPPFIPTPTRTRTVIAAPRGAAHPQSVPKPPPIRSGPCPTRVARPPAHSIGCARRVAR